MMEYVNGGEVSLKKTFCAYDGSAVTGSRFKGPNLSLFPYFLLSLNWLLSLSCNFFDCSMGKKS